MLSNFIDKLDTAPKRQKQLNNKNSCLTRKLNGLFENCNKKCLKRAYTIEINGMEHNIAEFRSILSSATA